MLDGGGEFPVSLGELPGVGGIDIGQQIQCAGEGVGPLRGRLGTAQAVQCHREPVDVLGEPSRQVDVVALDVVERERESEPLALRLVGGRAEEDPVQGRAERVLREVPEAEGVPLPFADAPAGPGSGGPFLQPFEVVVDEAEPPAHRRGPGEVEDLAGGHPCVGEPHERRDDRQHRVGAAQAAVGETHP